MLLRRLLTAAVLLLPAGLGGCASYFHQTFINPEPARLGAEVNGNELWRHLPPARQRVVVAVYKFRDQTGQYKPQANGSSFSTAVTQGATTILLRALEESQWFDPIERENLGNLLNERKIIRSTRDEYAQQTGQRQPNLPPLLFAGIILEGGIISYDSNIITGGAGLRYFGAGASGQYRQDRVTVYLRAISTNTGKILKTVYTSKTILSQQVDASLFQFVAFKRLLETETGFTYNEPSEMAVKDAIEKSVQSLIYEGLLVNIWASADTAATRSLPIQAYLREKQENLSIDPLGRQTTFRRRPLGVGFNGAVQLYQGDYALPQYRAAGELTLRYRLGDGYFSTFLNVGRGALAAGPNGNYFTQRFNYADVGLLACLFPYDRFSPYVLAGVGASSKSFSNFSSSNNLVPQAVVGVGAEFLVSSKLGIQAGIDNHFYLNDRIDQVVQGRYNDSYWGGRLGLNLYIGKAKSKNYL
ncbi:CsgG/HfaB family protein [Hymenobacter monticola]|uniref:Curli production assembly/transport component CsgG n=1 Tax=Hymenobacter monticola TaxID=1705399 RepID=A0ABY4B7S6_9BACT|nr:CsgG/HfaB family protein [Hymenobacter monticola]UOE35085.1 curli production assembly/transport component CsgG [Hymenobacter monticola]